jgi:hypothetical protein
MYINRTTNTFTTTTTTGLVLPLPLPPPPIAVEGDRGTLYLATMHLQCTYTKTSPRTTKGFD